MAELNHINYTENLFQAIDTIVAERIHQQTKDVTVVATIVDARQRARGIYKVTEDNRFIYMATSQYPYYEEGNQVYVLKAAIGENIILNGRIFNNKLFPDGSDGLPDGGDDIPSGGDDDEPGGGDEPSGGDPSSEGDGGAVNPDDEIKGAVTSRYYTHGTSPYWHTLFASPKYIQANATPTYSVENIPIEGFYASGGAYTAYQYISLPAPMRNLTLLGVGDRGGAYVSGVDRMNRVGARYRIIYPAAEQGDTTIPELYTRLFLAGEIKKPPTDTDIPYDETGARQALDLAQSYVDAQLSGRQFSYGKNWLYTKSDILNVGGAGMVECDTYMALVLRGVDYANSPYALPTSTETFDYDTLHLNPHEYPWVTRLLETIRENIYLHRDVRFAPDIAWMMWFLGGVFSDINNAHPGDLVFWNNPLKNTYFGQVSHVGLLDFDGVGTPWVYEVTTEANSEGRVLQKVPLLGKREPCYFGRIDYRGETQYTGLTRQVEELDSQVSAILEDNNNDTE